MKVKSLGVTLENTVEEINMNANNNKMFLKNDTTVLTGSLAKDHAHMTAINERNKIKAS
jgi:hypothetical protein